MIAKLPKTLARPLEEAEKCSGSGDWFRAMNYMLDFLETGVTYTSLVLMGMFRNAVLRSGITVRDGVTQAVRKIDLKRPLSFGDWVNDILAPLATEAPKEFPDNAFAVSMGATVSRKKNILLGMKGEQSVVQIRNRYKGHGTVLSQDLYKEVVDILAPRVKSFADAISPIADCGVDLEHDLNPLVHRSDTGNEYVFQTLNDEAVSFLSTDENTLPLLTSSMNQAFDAWMQVLLPSFDIAKDLNWSEMSELMQDCSRAYLRDIYAQKKYNREQFVEREQLRDSYNEFLDSDNVIFPLTGEAGQGKTNQLCYWTETFMERDEGVLIFAGSSFTDVNLESRIRSVFGLSEKKKMEQYIEKVNETAAAAGKTVYVFFDAINEAIAYPGLTEGDTGPRMLYCDIYRLFGKNTFKNIKVLLTCRSYTWNNDIVPEQAKGDQTLFFVPKDASGATVRGFTDSEVQKAYGIYGELFQMETPFNELKRGSVIRLKDPLMLKIACTNYLGKQLPQNQADYTSISLFAHMLDDISHSYAGKRQVSILNEIARYMLERYIAGEAIDSIMVEDLRNAVQDTESPLHKAATLMFSNDGITVAFAELLNRPERPVLRMVEQSKVQFIYERFLEYLLSCAYMDNTDTLTPDKLISDMQHAAVNEVFLGAMRNVLLMDYGTTGSSDMILGLLSRYGDNMEAFSLVTGMIDVLIKELYTREIFDVERSLLSWKDEGADAVITEFNKVCREIDSNKASQETQLKYRELSERLTSLIRIRNLAGVSVIGGILLSDAFNESLYEEDAFSLVWKLMDDPIVEVKNNACMQAYYVSKRTHTLSYEPLNENVTQQIIRRMFDYLRKRSLPRLMIGRARRNRTVTFLETGVRLDVLLIIDLLLEGTKDDQARVDELMDEIRNLMKHLTLRYTLIRILMPFFSWILRRQVTFQSAYVNNLTEYKTFWNDSIVAPLPTEDGRWNRSDVTDIAPLAFLYSRYYDDDASLKGEQAPDITPFRDRIVAAYQTGDSLSYFLLERLMVIFGLSDWDKTDPILSGIDRSISDTEWFDYSQMSLIYIMYQLGLKMNEYPQSVMEMLERNCVDWTRRCRGYFKGHNSHVANPLQLYKRNVMSWYAMVWCTRNGDVIDTDGSSVPLFRKLITESVETGDKELLVHLINNIAELITDSGNINTALSLFKMIFELIPSAEALERFEQNAPSRYPDTAGDVIKLIGDILGIAKRYYPAQVNDFLSRETVGLTFPGLSKFKDDLLSYNPGGEKLSDLFTHKFGNFIIWALIHEEGVDEVVSQCLKDAASSADSAAWFDHCVRNILRSMLKIKI